MDNSLLAAEYLLRARRTFKEAKIAFDDGDLYYVVIRILDTIQNLSKTLLVFNNKYDFNLYWNASMLSLNDEIEKSLFELELRLMPMILLNESSLKTPSVIIRNKEAEILLEEIGKILEKVEQRYDEYHSWFRLLYMF